MNLQSLLVQLDQLVVQGKLLDAIHQFFHPDVVCYSDPSDAMYGKQTKYDDTSQFLEDIAEIKNITLHSQAFGDRVTFSEITFDFTRQDGKKVIWNEVIRRYWKDGLVIDEKYYNCECNRTEGPMPLQVGLTNQTDPLLPQKLVHLDQLVAQGNFLDAVDQYFHPEVVCQSNPDDAIYGKQTKYDLMRHFLRGVAQINNCTLHSHGVGGQVTMSEHTFEFTQHDGKKLVWNEVIRRYWKDGLVIDEKYYTCDCNKDGEGEPHATSEHAPSYYYQQGYIGAFPNEEESNTSFWTVAQDIEGIAPQPQTMEMKGINPAFRWDFDISAAEEMEREMSEAIQADTATAPSDEARFTWQEDTMTILGEVVGENSDLNADVPFIEPTQFILDNVRGLNWESEAQSIIGETLGEWNEERIDTLENQANLGATIDWEREQIDFQNGSFIENTFGFEGNIAEASPAYLSNIESPFTATTGFEGTIDSINEEIFTLEVSDAIAAMDRDEVFTEESNISEGDLDVFSNPTVEGTIQSTYQSDISSLFYPPNDGNDILPEPLTNLEWINRAEETENVDIPTTKQQLSGDPFSNLEHEETLQGIQGSLFETAPEFESYNLQRELPFYEIEPQIDAADTVLNPVETIFDSTGAVDDFAAITNESISTPLFEGLSDLDVIAPIETSSFFTADITPTAVSNNSVYSQVAFVGQEIPDGFGRSLFSGIDLNYDGNVEELGVNVDIEHPFIQDLIVKLIAPSGNMVTLHNREGVLDDSIRDIKRWYSKEYFTVFKGEPIRGVWNLEVSDNSKRDSGRLNQWSIYVLPESNTFVTSDVTSAPATESSVFITSDMTSEPEMGSFDAIHFDMPLEPAIESSVFITSDMTSEPEMGSFDAIHFDMPLAPAIESSVFITSDMTSELEMGSFDAIHYDMPSEPVIESSVFITSDMTSEPEMRSFDAIHYDMPLEPVTESSVFITSDMTSEPEMGSFDAIHFDMPLEPVTESSVFITSDMTSEPEAETMSDAGGEYAIQQEMFGNFPRLIGEGFERQDIFVDEMIPDNTGALVSRAKFVVPKRVAQMDLAIDIQHPCIGDLIVNLIAPSGKALTLHNREGGYTENLTRYYGVEFFEIFNREYIAGDWRLEVSDKAVTDIGRLKSWSIGILSGTEEMPAEKVILETVEESPAVNYTTSVPGAMRGNGVFIQELRVDMVIPDDAENPLVTSITLEKTGTVKDLGLFIDIEHPFCTDLKIVLEAPSGNSAIVYDREGGFSNNMIHYYNSEYFPELIGESIEGVWTLRVYDYSPAYAGRLNAWKLYVLPA